MNQNSKKSHSNSKTRARNMGLRFLGSELVFSKWNVQGCIGISKKDPATAPLERVLLGRSFARNPCSA